MGMHMSDFMQENLIIAYNYAYTEIIISLM